MKKQAPRRRTKRTIPKKKWDRTALAKAKFITAYKHRGNVTKACAACHVSRSAYYEWLAEDAAFEGAVETAYEAVIDHVEDRLMRLINRGEPSAVYFFLKCRAKNRGYVERQQIDANLNLTAKMSMADLRKSIKGTQDANAGK